MIERYDQDMILGYVEGELNDDQRARFEALLGDDHELRQLVSQMKLDREALRSLGGVPAPVGLVDRVIQTQERAALLGDPASPDPLPLAMPVTRWNMRRVLAYSGIAAVLLLSFGVVIQSLVPPDLLDHEQRVARRPSYPDGLNGLSGGAGGSGVASGLALADEDAVYDGLDLAESEPMKIGTEMALSEPAAAKPKLAADTAAAKTVAGRMAVGDPPASAATSMKTSPASEAATASALAVGDPDAQPDADSAHRTETLTGRLARAEPVDEAVAVEPVAALSGGAFAGYVDRQTPRQAQLLIESASPTQARRDIRDWAIQNSARVVEVPARGGFGGAGVTFGRTRAVPGDRGLTAASTESSGAPQQLVVVVYDRQVPGLLKYLNRGRGQHATLVSADVKLDAAREPVVTDAPLAKRSAKKATGQTESDVDTEKVKTSTALANRLVDTRSGWRQNGMAMGLASTPAAQDKHESHKPTATDKPVATQPDSPPEPTSSADTFDWARLLESRSKATATPPPAPQPQLQPEAPRRVRLWVVIRQVADEVVGSESDADRPAVKPSGLR